MLYIIGGEFISYSHRNYDLQKQQYVRTLCSDHRRDIRRILPYLSPKPSKLYPSDNSELMPQIWHLKPTKRVVQDRCIVQSVHSTGRSNTGEYSAEVKVSNYFPENAVDEAEVVIPLRPS